GARMRRRRAGRPALARLGSPGRPHRAAQRRAVAGLRAADRRVAQGVPRELWRRAASGAPQAGTRRPAGAGRNAWVGMGMISDTPPHLWALGRGHYPWLEHAPIATHFGDYGAICRDYLPADYRADTAGFDVVKSVHVQAEWDERDPVAETRFLEGQAASHGVPDAIVAFAELQSPDIAATLDAHQQASPRLRGIRMLLRKPNHLAAC